MKYKPYPKYKDSGVEWLGAIPEEWECSPLFSVLPEHYVQNVGMQSEEVLSLSYGQIVKKDVSDNFGLLPESFETYQLVEPDDIVLRLTDLQNDQRSLRTAISSYSGIITSAYLKLRCTQNPAYFHWLLHSADTQKVFYGFGGGVRQSMKYADLKRFPLVVPIVSTQRAIATFLDTATARIDALIKDYENLIALLKEKRQALISHAVTRGLSEIVSPDDPEFGEWAKPVKLKDTGIEWIGEIPEGWLIGPLKHFASSQKGAIKTGPFGSQLTASDMNNSDVKVYNQRSVIDNDFSLGDNYITKTKFEELCSFEVFSGDVLVTTRGTIGKCAIVPDHIERGILHPCLLRVQIDEQKLTREFLVAIVQESQQFKFGLSHMSNATTIEVIYSDTISNLYIPVPPVSEQHAIVSFLNRETSKIDTLVSESESAIELLKEHRSALITNAVTGKINVENIA